MFKVGLPSQGESSPLTIRVMKFALDDATEGDLSRPAFPHLKPSMYHTRRPPPRGRFGPEEDLYQVLSRRTAGLGETLPDIRFQRKLCVGDKSPLIFEGERLIGGMKKNILCPFFLPRTPDLLTTSCVLQILTC